MDQPYEVIEHKGYKIEVWPDEDPTSPREWDNAGTMVCWHRRGKYGDEQPKVSVEEWLRSKLSGTLIKTLEDHLDEIDNQHLWLLFRHSNLVIPIMAYEHGGITIRAYDYGNFPDQQFDCGQLGFIYISHENIMKEWGGKHIGKRNLEKARQCLLSEISTYDEYLTGAVYGFKIIDPDGEETDDSCWGFYGKQYMIDECKGIVDSLAEKREQAKLQAIAFTANPMAA